MKQKLNSLIVFAMMLILSSYGQEKYNIIQEGGNGMAPSAIDFDATQKEAKKSSSFSSPENFMKENFGTVSGQGVIVSDVIKDELGFTHYRLQQSINGIPVESSMYLIHVKNGQVTSANGEWFTATPAKSFAKSSTLSSAQALQKAKEVIKAKQYVWEARAPRTNNKTFNGEKVGDEGELVYITINNVMDANALRLAYKFDMYSVEPFGRKEVFVDAANGEILFIEEKILHVDGTTDTGYYGPKNITVTQTGGRYEMRQSGTRNFGLHDMNRGPFRFGAGGNPNNPYEPTNASVVSSSTKDFNFSGDQKYRMSAYWGAEKTWDMFKDIYNRSSYDGKGTNFKIYINGSGKAAGDNAFWNGTWTYFGDPDQHFTGTPITPLDVVGHEITHGVTGTSARLVYQGESGALNEAFSDIFGSLVEYYTFDKVIDAKVWKLADKHPDQKLKRDLSNPKLHRQPDTYNGTNWASTSGGDNGGVHTNSGVLNHWFYIVSQGAKGSNDNSTAYDVEGIGIEKAGKIAFRSLTKILTSRANYTAARNAVITAAKDLYGANSCELKVVTNAMNAVGVGAKFTGNANCDGGGDCSAISGVTASNVTKNGATINWNAVNGISTYTFEYKKSTDASYTASSVTGTSKTLDGLTVDTAYEVRLKYACTNGETAPYSTIVKFTTTADGGGNCKAVTGVNSSNITVNSATVSWTGINGVSSYTFEYKKATDASYTTSTVSGVTTNLTGLAANTKYEARVKYTCSTGGTDPCAGVQAYQQGQTYQVGDKVTFQGNLYERVNTTTGWKNLGPCGGSGGNQVDAPYSAVITFTTLEDTTGGNCDNIPEYQPGTAYPIGAKVKYFGTIYQRTATSWVVIGSCDATFFASAFGNNLNNATGFNVYPNPASNDLNISFNSLDNVSQIRIVNILGKVVYNKEVKSTLGNNTVKVDVSRLNPGIYFVKRGNQDVKKVIIK